MLRREIVKATRAVLESTLGENPRRFKLEVQTHGDGGELSNYATLAEWDGGWTTWTTAIHQAKAGDEIHVYVMERAAPGSDWGHGGIYDTIVLYVEDDSIRSDTHRADSDGKVERIES